MNFFLMFLISLTAVGISFARDYSILGRVNDNNGLTVNSCSVMIYSPNKPKY